MEIFVRMIFAISRDNVSKIMHFIVVPNIIHPPDCSLSTRLTAANRIADIRLQITPHMHGMAELRRKVK